MLEYEKKILLSKEEYLIIIKTMCGNVHNATIQTNYYFDTDDFSMNKKGVTCRIRGKNGKYVATVKNHGGSETDCSVETTVEIKNQFDTEIFNEMGLSLQGTLVTERTQVYKDEFCQAVLDRNFYSGKTDYELEIEYLHDCETYATQLLNEIAQVLVFNKHITGIKDLQKRMVESKSKSERFFDSKK